ncbi:hydroxymethylbilane synthase [Nordella sp. HKS 07]|uniref:hydroxymethylbilane synthase n=1 Tax=Nordella sp. HKS 07 TaxID=2712222 RepID=UPI0013E11BE9|nr:hydroxymethylbilane synthase [Nordella sp. HKS 07]QIG48011.1 hydroxymethylbilane synthase [Nordella sp. HKS 07]
MHTPRLKIGTRGSRLALAQAEETRARLAAAHGWAPADIEIVAITTTGDRIRDRPLSEIGGKGLFTKEIEEALVSGAVDLAVHSMKDMPAVLPASLAITAYLPREDARDAFISNLCARIGDLQQGCTVGSASVRRAAQLKRLRPDITVVSLRGNVETRLAKLDRGEVAATFLACAGLNRLGLSHRITAPVPEDEMLPAVAQGAIGIEIRKDDMRMRELLAAVNDAATEIAVTCERAFLATLDGSCRTPIAGHATLKNGVISFRGEALTLDGRMTFVAERTGALADAARLGREAGEEVKAKGGGHLLHLA